MDLRQLRIIHYPDPRLRKPSEPVQKIDPFIADLTTRMFELMYEVKGLGLAAVQVGLNLRLFVTNPTGQPGGEGIYINPEIIEMRGAVDHEEGCLSLPDVLVGLKRARWCKIRAFGLDGKPFEEEATDLFARAWQHEIDHLDGVLICDRMSPTAKIANRRLLKDLESTYEKRRSGKGRIRVP